MQKSYIALSVTACTQSLRSTEFVGLDMYVVLYVLELSTEESLVQ